jgi:hypothetical protein
LLVEWFDVGKYMERVREGGREEEAMTTRDGLRMMNIEENLSKLKSGMNHVEGMSDA